MKKRFLSLLLTATMVVSLTACGSKNKNEGATTPSPVPGTEAPADNSQANGNGTSANTKFKVSMVTDTGGVNDQSFNQSAWEGLQSLAKNRGAEISFLESVQESDYPSNLDKQVDEGKDLIWGVGFAMSSAIKEAAEMNPEVRFGIIDNSYGDETPENVTGVMFSAQDPSFMVGYIAGLTTKTDKVGFVGGTRSDIIDQFEYGYRAGVAHAAKELGKDIKVEVHYAESFGDAAKGKAIATKMYSSGCDIVFHAAGNVGVGVIEAAVEANKFAIGVDRDQSALAPKNILTSALKLVNVAIEHVSAKAMDGEEIGGKTYTFGLAEDAVGIPKKNPNMDPAVYEKAMELRQKIKDGTIVPPYNETTYKEFIK